MALLVVLSGVETGLGIPLLLVGVTAGSWVGYSKTSGRLGLNLMLS